MRLTIYHNPRCSKSREALALLREKGHAPKVVYYIKSPLCTLEIMDLLRQLDIRPIEMMRTREVRFKELGLSKRSSDSELIYAMAENARLIERPIISNGIHAVIGRPPENLLTLL